MPIRIVVFIIKLTLLVYIFIRPTTANHERSFRFCPPNVSLLKYEQHGTANMILACNDILLWNIALVVGSVKIQVAMTESNYCCGNPATICVGFQIVNGVLLWHHRLHTVTSRWQIFWPSSYRHFLITTSLLTRTPWNVGFIIAGHSGICIMLVKYIINLSNIVAVKPLV